MRQGDPRQEGHRLLISKLFLLGGARSGKSTLAEQAATRLSADGDRPVTTVVTAVAFDEEMAARIERHRLDRPAGWTTVEAPEELVGAVEAVPDDTVLLLDCVTVWLGNLMVRGDDVAAIEAAGADLTRAIAARLGPTVVVSNEVGLGIVPGDPMSRSFRDLQGRVNAALAESVDDARFVVAGRLVRLERLDDVLGE